MSDKYRMLATGMHDDIEKEKISGDGERLLFRLMLDRSTNLAGIISNLAIIQQKLHWTQRRFEKTIEELKPFVEYFPKLNMGLLIHFSKTQCGGERAWKGALNQIEIMPDGIILRWLHHNYKEIPKGICDKSKHTLCNRVSYRVSDTLPLCVPDNQTTDNRQQTTDNRIPPNPPQGGDHNKIPFRSLLELFNATCTDLPKAREINEARKRHLRQRWREHPDLEWWRALFAQVQASDWLTGRDPKANGWRATLDWLIKPTNLLKVAEGNYDRKREAALPLSEQRQIAVRKKGHAKVMALIERQRQREVELEAEYQAQQAAKRKDAQQ